AIADAGATFVGTCVARLDRGVREHFLTFLPREYPALVEGYERLYAGHQARPDYVAQVQGMVQMLAERAGVRRSAGSPSAEELRQRRLNLREDIDARPNENG